MCLCVCGGTVEPHTTWDHRLHDRTVPNGEWLMQSSRHIYTYRIFSSETSWLDSVPDGWASACESEEGGRSRQGRGGVEQ